MRLFCFVVLSFVLLSCSSKKHRNVSSLTETSKKSPSLNIFVPKKKSTKPYPVLLFVHGGNWDGGDKNLYSLIGRRFAKKGILFIAVGYTLSPDADYDKMTSQIAEAINWTLTNISSYGGNPDQLFLTGHSAGGHLVALACMKPKYSVAQQRIAGIILNDAAGLDMHHYLQSHPPTEQNHYLTTWTNDPQIWEEASPINYVSAENPPFMVYLGTKTYRSIKTSNERFLRALKPYKDVQPIKIDKNHVAMITQYFNGRSKRYHEIIEFIKR